MLWLYYLLTLGAGAANPLQSGANAELRKGLSSILWAGVLVYVTGLIGVLLIELFARQAFPGADRFAAVRWWAWTGGLASIGSTLAGVALAQRLGSGAFTGLNITAALGMSIVFDNYGWVGFKQHPVTPMRIVGCVLMVAGVWIVART
jgi:transporter family-2 protein